MNIKLSLCIPTYNFAKFIGETIESILPQLTDEVEIIIVDGASTDNTREVVSGYQSKFPRISYFIRDKNVGVDKDLAKSVELARGEYCWFLSSDDKISAGAINRVLKEIKDGYDIYLCNRTECDFNLRPLRDRLWLSKDIGDRVFNLSDRNELKQYLNNSRSIGALFSYCSSIIFNREKWNLLQYEEEFTDTGYAHVKRLFSLRNLGCKLKYIREPLVFCRGNNDSFLSRGKVKRFLFDIDGYQLLAERLFGNEPLFKNAFLKVMTREMRLHYLMEIRSLTEDKAAWRQIRLKLTRFGFNNYTILLADFLGSLKVVVALMLYFKGMIKKRREGCI